MLWLLPSTPFAERELIKGQGTTAHRGGLFESCSWAAESREAGTEAAPSGLHTSSCPEHSARASLFCPELVYLGQSFTKQRARLLTVMNKNVPNGIMRPELLLHLYNSDRSSTPREGSGEGRHGPHGDEDRCRSRVPLHLGLTGTRVPSPSAGLASPSYNLGPVPTPAARAGAVSHQNNPSRCVRKFLLFS